MGGYPSKEKKEDVPDITFTKRKKRRRKKSSSTSQWSVFSSVMNMTPPNEDSSKLENYGILPDLVITSIALFVDIKDLPNIFCSCRLFYHCANSEHFWKLYYENIVSDEVKNKINDNHQLKSLQDEKKSPVFITEFHSHLFEDKKKERIDNNNQDEKKNENRNNNSWKRLCFSKLHSFTDERYYLKKYQRPKGVDFDRGTRLKVVLLGKFGIGKTAFHTRVVRDIFQQYMEGGIGAAFCCSSFTNTQTEKTYTFELWDTAGQERYKSIAPMYLRGTDIILLCFDLTDRNTLFSKMVKNWIFEIKKQICVFKEEEEVKTRHLPIVILLGMKKDLESERDISKEEVVNFIIQQQQKDVIDAYIENSSKTGENVFLAMGIALDLFTCRCQIYEDDDVGEENQGLKKKKMID